MAEAKLTVDTQLDKVISQLQKIRDTNKEVGKSLESVGKTTGDAIQSQSKKTEMYFQRMRDLGRNLAEGLKNDFKALLSLNALQGVLSLNNQFQQVLKDSVSLTDSLSLMGNTMGLTASQQARFKDELIESFAQIGMGAGAASEAVSALRDSVVRGESDVLRFARAGALLSQATGAKNIAGTTKGLEQVLVAGRRNIQDPVELDALMKSVTRTSVTTGKGATDVLGSMLEQIRSMTENEKRSTNFSALGERIAATQATGPEAMAFFKQLQSTAVEFRAQFQSAGKILNDQGAISLNGLKQFRDDLKNRGISPELAATTFGFQGESGAGLVALAKNVDKVIDSMERMQRASDDAAKMAENSRSVLDAFMANIYETGAAFVKLMDAMGVTTDLFHSLRDFLNSTARSPGKAAALTAAAVTGGAALTGGALTGIASFLGTGAAATVAGAGGALGLGAAGVGAAGVAGYGAANLLGAEKLGIMISNAIYDALHNSNMNITVNVPRDAKDKAKATMNRGTSQ
jgi:hypothetical protein